MKCKVCGNKTATAMLKETFLYKDGRRRRFGVYRDICKECGYESEPYQKEIKDK